VQEATIADPLACWARDPFSILDWLCRFTQTTASLLTNNLILRQSNRNCTMPEFLADWSQNQHQGPNYPANWGMLRVMIRPLKLLERSKATRNIVHVYWCSKSNHIEITYRI